MVHGVMGLELILTDSEKETNSTAARFSPLVLRQCIQHREKTRERLHYVGGHRVVRQAGVNRVHCLCRENQLSNPKPELTCEREYHVDCGNLGNRSFNNTLRTGEESSPKDTRPLDRSDNRTGIEAGPEANLEYANPAGYDQKGR
jgi:hypothetical protein